MTPMTSGQTHAQIDIFGETHERAPAPPADLRTDANAYCQPRLFEPQFEGQLDLTTDNPDKPCRDARGKQD